MLNKGSAHNFKSLLMTNTVIETKTAKKILIVEDEGEMCLLLNILLTSGEMDLDHVKNLAAAGEYLSKEQPSVIILDNKLPDGFGIDYISYIKKNYPSIKIIMITGYDGAAKDIALENGVDSFLEKPFTRQQLFESVHALLS
jgi:DNA-binding response OmpR family regulator